MTPPKTTAGERARVRAVYARRDADAALRARYDPADSGTRFLLEHRHAALTVLLADGGLLPLGDRRVLEVGCGSGAELLALTRCGARRVVGIDLSAARLAAARAIAPVALADAVELPFGAGAFDVVAQFTTFTSLLDREVRSAAAAELRRVLRPGGAILWYDFWLARPGSQTRGIGLGELQMLFPGFRLDARRVTLLPPLARALAGRAAGLAAILERIAPLRTHFLALLTAPS